MNKTLKLKAHGKAFGKIAEYQLLSEAYHLDKFSLYVGNNAGVFIRPIRATEYFLPKYGISGLS